MTTSDMPWRQGRHPRFDYIATRLAHWTPLLILAAGAWMIGATFAIPDEWSFWQNVLTSIPIVLITIGLLGFASALVGWHLYVLCPVCARKTPLDPTKAVTRKRRRLATLHWLSDYHKWTKRALIALYALSFTPMIGPVFFFAIFTFMATEVYLYTIHMPLRPWCPQCRGRWGKGGDTEVVPDPDPVGADQKVS